MSRVTFFWKKNKSVLLYILLLFIVSRIVLSSIGVISSHYTPPDQKAWPSQQELVRQHPYLSMWTIWDSEWYLKIAKQGYLDSIPFNPQTQQSIGFLPLYPILISIVAFVVKDFVIAGLIVSNACFLLAAFVLYKLFILESHTEETARRAVFYLFLFPTAYIFSALYAESLFLALSLISIYAARKERWLYAGLAGFGLVLTKAFGFAIIVPLIWIYLSQKKFSWRALRFDALYIFLPVLSLLAFGLYSYAVTGDPLAYSHAQQFAWNHHLMNPLRSIFFSLVQRPFDETINAIAIIISFFILMLGYKKISFGYWLYACILILFVPTTGILVGSLRYLSVVFPLLIILAMYGKSRKIDRAINIALPLLQGCLFIYWVAGYWFIA